MWAVCKDIWVVHFKQGIIVAGGKRFQMTAVSYIIYCTFTLCLSGVVVGAGIQKCYPVEYFLNFPEYKSLFWEFFFTYFKTVERSSLTFATGPVVPPCGHIADYSIQVGVITFTLWEGCWVQLLLKCDPGNTKMTKNISVVVANVDIIRDGLQPLQILCQQCFKVFF